MRDHGSQLRDGRQMRRQVVFGWFLNPVVFTGRFASDTKKSAQSVGIRMMKRLNV